MRLYSISNCFQSENVDVGNIHSFTLTSMFPDLHQFSFFCYIFSWLEGDGSWMLFRNLFHQFSLHLISWDAIEFNNLNVSLTSFHIYPLLWNLILESCIVKVDLLASNIHLTLQLGYWLKNPLFNFKLNSKCSRKNSFTPLNLGEIADVYYWLSTLPCFYSKTSKIGFAETFDSYVYQIIDWCSSFFRRKVWKQYVIVR